MKNKNMTHSIYKYPLQIVDDQSLELPIGAGPVHVGEQKGQLCVWVYQSTDKKRQKFSYQILIFGTGNPVPERLDESYFHVGTVLMSNGLVWHVFWKM